MISVILPAARLQEQSQTIVDQLWQNNYVTDVVVASPNFDLERARCLRDAGVGSARVLAQTYSQFSFDTTHIAWLSEICLPEPRALDRMLEFVIRSEADAYVFDAFENKVSAPFIAEFRTSPSVTPGHYRVCTISGRQYARWGMLSRKTIDQIGGFFDPAFVAHYGDVDLSLRCWKNGGKVATCKEAVIEMHGHWHVSTAPHSEDEALFLERWKGDYPEIMTKHTSEWNVDQEIPL